MNKALALLSVLVLVAAPVSAFASVAITLTGGPITLYAGQTYVEPGYSANSTVDGDLTSSVVTSAVNTSVVGNTSRTYSVTDSALDSDTQIRSVTVLNNGGGPICTHETHHFATSCAGGIWAPAQDKPVVQKVLDGELMQTATGFVPSSAAYQTKFLADKAAAQANGTIDTWFQVVLASATYQWQP